MQTALPVDVERLLIDHLLADADLKALVGTRIGSQLPATPTWPFLTVTLITDTASYPNWLVNALVQFDAWGSTDAGGRASASLLSRTATVALLRLDGVATNEGIVTGVEPFGRHWLPDASVTPARPRYISQCRVHHHPLP